MLSMHDESIYAERVLRAGANGYIMKQEATELVLTAIRRILDGQVYVQRPRRRPDAAAVRRAARRQTRSPLASLSDRELEVFRLIGDGSSTREIAEALHLSVKTVESYQAHIKEKLALRTRASCSITRSSGGHRAEKPALEYRCRHRGIPDAVRQCHSPNSKSGPRPLEPIRALQVVLDCLSGSDVPRAHLSVRYSDRWASQPPEASCR